MSQQPSLARQQVMRLAGCGPLPAIRYGGRAVRRLRHLVPEGGPSPRPIKRLQRGLKPGNVREGLPQDGQLPFSSPFPPL